ncbi:MAG: ADOP family duplicated permease [Gemmatimonadaceae bacterium]
MRNPFSRGHGPHPFQAAPEAEVAAELAFHLEQRVRDYVARGMTPEAARAAAIERFGDVRAVNDECARLLEDERRSVARRDWLDDLRQDLRFGVRSALRAPLFSLLAIVTLALGIGANAAVFGVVKSVLLDALPYRDADRLVRVYGRMLDGTQERGGMSAGTITDIKARQRSFSRLGGFVGGPSEAIYQTEAGPRVGKVAWVEPELFPALGVAPALGRGLTLEDVVRDTVRNVVLSHAAWQRLYAGDPGAIGRPLVLNGITRTVVGVMPRGFVAPFGDADFYYPFNTASVLRDPVRARRSHFMGLVGRLRPGVAPEAARREMTAIGAALTKEYPADQGNIGVTAVPLRDALVGDTRTPLLVLMASAGLVLLITCANVAGALLSRTISRRKEFAVRVALGAGRGRLVRQLLSESLLLAGAGGAAGLVLAKVALSALEGLAPPGLLPDYVQLRLDPGAIGATALVALVTGLAFGLAPALSVSRANLHGTLRDESRGASESGRARRLRGMLVAGQIALCVSLLAGAGLLARSLWAMMAAPPGFDPRGVLKVDVKVRGARYASDTALTQFHEALEARVAALPGVQGVASVSELLTPMMNRNGLVIEGVQWANDQVPFINAAVVSDDYFRVMRIPLLRGRAFGPADRLGGAQAFVISESMAKKYWPKGNALGAHIRMGPARDAPWGTVVGIVGDVRADAARPTPEPFSYTSMRQEVYDSRTYVVRTGGDPALLVRPFQRELAAIDPTLPVADARPLEAVLSSGLSARRLPVVLMTSFGALALLLASVGVYALFASMAAAREREFGVRIALGSTPGAIAGLVLRQGGAWMALGLIAGALGVALVSRTLRGLLYGVSQFDPVALGAAVALLALCGAVALLAPVRRATRVDPIAVLR